MTILNKLSIKYLLILVVCILLSSCTKSGTLVNVDEGNNDKIEVYKYYYSNGNYVYVARFKKCPQVITTTWDEYNTTTKTYNTYKNITITENDSIQIIIKRLN